MILPIPYLIDSIVPTNPLTLDMTGIEFIWPTSMENQKNTTSSRGVQKVQ